jgi:hypothetical protein
LHPALGDGLHQRDRGGDTGTPEEGAGGVEEGVLDREPTALPSHVDLEAEEGMRRVGC